MKNPLNNSPKTSERGLRIAAALFFVGSGLMTIGALAEEEPAMLVAAILMGIAWLCFATQANRIERGDAQAQRD